MTRTVEPPLQESLAEVRPVRSRDLVAHRAEPEVRISEKWIRFFALDDVSLQEMSIESALGSRSIFPAKVLNCQTDGLMCQAAVP
jgi:hypothetical protein